MDKKVNFSQINIGSWLILLWGFFYFYPLYRTKLSQSKCSGELSGNYESVVLFGDKDDSLLFRSFYQILKLSNIGCFDGYIFRIPKPFKWKAFIRYKPIESLIIFYGSSSDIHFYFLY